MELRIETITPQKAKEYLSKNMVNRNISEQRVREFSSSMKMGKWQLNGEAIRFNKSGALIDGQHRLSAIIASDVSIDTAVIFDVDDDITLYDRGRVRNVTDSLIIGGMSKEIANSTNVAIAKLHYIVQKNISVTSDAEVEKFLNKYSDSLIILRSLIGRGEPAKSNRVNTKTAVIMLPLLYGIESGESVEKAEKFLEILKTGFYGNDNESSAIVCRNDILAGNISSGGNSTDRRYSSFRVEKAFYDFCRNIPRRRTYSNDIKRIYSNNIKFSEV